MFVISRKPMQKPRLALPNAMALFFLHELAPNALCITTAQRSRNRLFLAPRKSTQASTWRSTHPCPDLSTITDHPCTESMRATTLVFQGLRQCPCSAARTVLKPNVALESVCVCLAWVWVDVRNGQDCVPAKALVCGRGRHGHVRAWSWQGL